MKPPTINAELFTIIECVLLHSASRFEFFLSVDDESIAKDIPALYPVCCEFSKTKVMLCKK